MRLNLRFFRSISPDHLFVILLFVLVVFGLVMLTSASSDLAKARFGDSYYYIRHQVLFGLSIGILGFLVGAIVPYRFWEKWAGVFLVLSLVLLVLVFTPLGIREGGSDRWLEFLGIRFQPSEFVKLTFLMYLSSWFSRSSIRQKSWSEGLLPFLCLVGVVALLLLLQPSTSTTAIIFLASLIMYFTAGARFRFVIAAVFLAILALTSVLYLGPGYRLQRVAGFLNPAADELGTTYHINQSLLALGSGGVFGVGYGQSTTKLRYLPEPIGDSIFAVVGEELGFVGAMLFIAVFILFIFRGLIVAKNARDSFGRLLVTGFISLIGIQAFVNIGAVSGLIPFTGVPLPFVSYGGTALAVMLTMCGIIVNVSKSRR